MSIRGLLFQRASTIKLQNKRTSVVQSGRHRHLIENKLVLAMTWLKIC